MWRCDPPLRLRDGQHQRQVQLHLQLPRGEGLGVGAAGAGAISNCPAVWTDGQSWPTDGELDVMEGLSGQACWHFHDPQGGPGGCSSATYTGGWHTYGADWEPGT